MEFKYPSDEYLKRLGMVTISFSDLEWSLGILLEVIVDPASKLATIISSHLSFKRLLDVISSTYVYRWPECEHRPALEEILKRCQAAEEERNLLVHSTYSFPDGTPNELLVRTKSTARRKIGLRHTKQDISIEKLDKYLDELVETVTEVTRFLFLIMEKHRKA